MIETLFILDGVGMETVKTHIQFKKGDIVQLSGSKKLQKGAYEVLGVIPVVDFEHENQYCKVALEFII